MSRVVSVVSVAAATAAAAAAEIRDWSVSSSCVLMLPVYAVVSTTSLTMKTGSSAIP